MSSLTNPEAIYEGLQISKKHNPLKLKVKEVIVEKKMSDEEIKKKEGQYFEDKDVDKIFDEDVDVYTKDEKGNKKLLAKLRKHVIDPEIVKVGWEGFWITASASRNRGAAAGPINLEGTYWKKRKPIDVKGWLAKYQQDGKISKMRVSNNVFSTVLGYYEATPFMKLPCRLTNRTMRYFKYYKHGLPFISALDTCFKKLIPGPYKIQRKAIDTRPLLQIENTAFSTITMNRNFRTALHKDAGDYSDGFGNLSVIERGYYHGGHTLFPQYKIGFNLRSGDFLAMDNHEWHCNTKLYETSEDKKKNKGLPEIYKDNKETGTLGSEHPFTRLSFVCYVREKILNCKTSETRKYYKKIGFDKKRMTLKKQKINTPLLLDNIEKEKNEE